MIDFQNASYVQLSQVDVTQVADQINPLLVDGLQPSSYKGMRDYVVFTSKRIIAVNVQGITGKKKDFTSLPLSKIQAFCRDRRHVRLGRRAGAVVLRPRQGEV